MLQHPSERVPSLFLALELVASLVTKSFSPSLRQLNMKRFEMTNSFFSLNTFFHSPETFRLFQFLEVVRLEGHAYSPEDMGLARDMYLLQLCSGVDEDVVGGCAQLVFAPIDESFADDAPLLPSGFRVIPLEPKSTPVIHQNLI